MPADRPPTTRRIALATMLTLFALIVISCGPGVQDYSYPIVGGYELMRCSRDVIIIQYSGPAPYPANTSIKEKVVALNWGERYILVKRQHVNANGRPKSGEFDWWVIDTRDHVRYGPLNEGEFGDLRARLGIDANVELKKPTAFIPKTLS